MIAAELVEPTTEFVPAAVTGGTVITVTPNPAVDVTYHLPRAEWGEVNRVQTVTRRAGGKGVNVASALRQLGVKVATTGFLGGTTGEALAGLLDESAIEQRWVPITGQTRCTTVVVDDLSATLLNEPGPAVTSAD